MTQQELAEEKLKGMLKAAELPVKASYNPGEVCRILGVADRTFWRLVSQYERDERGNLRRPDCLDSYTITTHRRVHYGELVAFLYRNNTYERRNAVDPAQMALFADF
jgi:hypothetical protein